MELQSHLWLKSLLMVLLLIVLHLSSCATTIEARKHIATHMSSISTEDEVKEQDQHKGSKSPKWQINLGKPDKVIIDSDGGRFCAWREKVEAIHNAAIGVGMLELEENGLLLPKYSDANKVAYVLEGSGWMGAVLPKQRSPSPFCWRSYVRHLEKGDVVVIPKGIVYWWYNDANKVHRVLFAGDTTWGARPGHFNEFGLAGGKHIKEHDEDEKPSGPRSRYGSLLHGFSQDILAKAWGVCEDTMQSLLQSQSGAGIVKVKQRIELHDMHSHQHDFENSHDSKLHSSSHNFHPFYPIGELKYNILKSNQPDFVVRNGGWLNTVTHFKLPALFETGFSCIAVSMEKNAMFAPSFVRNAHQLLYVTGGFGRVQVASGDGETVFDEDVTEGTLIVIPQFFAALKVAGDKGIEWINILTSSGPLMSFLAGRSSVYRHIPYEVSEAAFNVDKETLMDIGRDEDVIFPPFECSHDDHREYEEDEFTYRNVNQRMQKTEDLSKIYPNVGEIYQKHDDATRRVEWLMTFLEG